MMLKPNGYNALRIPHRFLGTGPLWTVSKGGVRLEGEPLPFRTQGPPLTAGKIISKYGDIIDNYSQKHKVPAALIIATIATETKGDPVAVRREPGYVSDENTPNKISVGLMQTLLSTATQMRGYRVSSSDLRDPECSIDLGTRYICTSRSETCFDPVGVAAFYNAGGIYPDKNPSNIWGLRCYPMGTGRHITRFVEFYGDACALLGA